MKKIIFVLTVPLLLTGCFDKVEEKEISDNKEEEVVEEIDSYIDDNPITVGLYINGKLINEYNTTFRNDMDIASFDVYFTNDEDVGSSNTKNNFKKYYNNYENIDNYKIGFYVTFNANGKKYEKVVLDSDCEFALTPYIYLYLYDDIHQPDNTWYSHVTKEEEKSDTIFSSIKLYLAERYDEIESAITLTVFTYDGEEDFDEQGYYRGKSSHTVIINNK